MKTPLEVKLVDDVRNCKTCQWFWGATPPYGDFPVYDWNEDYPEAVRNQKQTTDYVKKPIIKVKACGQGQVAPGVMHGCRKAPIMTIGINPNMTAYFPSETGAVWAYPDFGKSERYAYYYRHHNVYQESLDLDFIKENIVSGTEIIAEQDGWLTGSNRCSDHRWLLLTIEYVDGSHKEVEVAWTDRLRFVVLVNTNSKKDPEKLSFKKGDVIGAKIAGLIGENKQLYDNSTGYYQRYVYVLERFKKLMAGQPVSEADLSISEDVAQHDMIACASPGWSSQYDIPTDRITRNCVMNHAFLVSQLIQTKPSVIVIVGGSSLEMFARVFAPFLTDFDYYYEVENGAGEKIKVIKETYQLLKETTEKAKFLHIKIGNYELKSRIVISPHFSYPSNFVEQSRLSETAWKAFQSDFVEDTQILIKEGRVQENSWNSIVPVRICGKDDSIREKLSSSAWDVLMAYYYDPIDMLARVLQQEYNAGRITYDASIKRLKRTEGSCKFCVNNLWQFVEGCPYGKNTITPPADGELEAIVRQVVDAGTVG
ncbi:MAG: hypothetical protein H6537_05510 [Bacteroidales bacterium]|nr:hypothetical protein [Bacteroidales bacterium]